MLSVDARLYIYVLECNKLSQILKIVLISNNIIHWIYNLKNYVTSYILFWLVGMYTCTDVVSWVVLASYIQWFVCIDTC